MEEAKLRLEEAKEPRGEPEPRREIRGLSKSCRRKERTGGGRRNGGGRRRGDRWEGQADGGGDTAVEEPQMKKLKAARLSKIGECQSWGLLDGGATQGALSVKRSGRRPRLEEVLGLIRVKFDQGAMGHIKREDLELEERGTANLAAGQNGRWGWWRRWMRRSKDRFWRRQEWQRHRRRKCGRATSRMAIPHFAETAGLASRVGSEEGAIRREVTRRPWLLWQST